MATPPGGHPFGGPQAQQAPLKRFNFPSAPSHRQQPAGAHQEPAVPAAPPEPPQAPQEVPQQAPREARLAAPPLQPPAPSRAAAHEADGDESAFATSYDHQPLVRPYAMTGGRTRPRYQLAIEALVSTTADPDVLRTQLPEHQRICQLCREVKSVAEVSALLSIPLGVARILVADLAEAGLVAIHQPGGDEAAGGQPDVTLLERVLSGLRKL